MRFQNEALASTTHEHPGFPQWLLFLPPSLPSGMGESLIFSPPLSKPSTLSWQCLVGSVPPWRCLEPDNFEVLEVG